MSAQDYSPAGRYQRKRAARQRAVALGYNPEEDSAPRVLASGSGVIAQKIVALANANGIPVHEDEPLAEALISVNVGEMIPPELYRVVAEVLAYIYRVQERSRGKG